MDDLLKAFARDVANMRKAQKTYFRTRATGALQEAKRLESQVDETVKQILTPDQSDGQQMLF